MSDASSADWDGAWKDSVSALLPKFMAMFRPKAYSEIDWSRGYELLDKELQKIVPDSATGPRTVDLLFKVWLLSGEEQWVLIHLEVQAQRIADLPKRVYFYHVRIENCYDRPVVSIVILADDDAHWRPESYTSQLWGCSIDFRFPVVKLLDFTNRQAELAASDNPFAVVVLAHLKARETAGDRGRRREWKVRLLKGLYNRGWDREDIRQLLKTIDWFLTLPRADDRLVREAIEADEKDKHMPYISSFEQMAMEEGEERGRIAGLSEGLSEGLKAGITLGLKLKFGEAGKRLASELNDIQDVEILRRMTASLETAGTLDELRELIAR